MAPRASRCVDALQQRLHDGLVLSISQRYFMPASTLDEILTLKTISEVVEELTINVLYRQRLPQTIYREGKKVFAMLIYNDHHDHLVDFWEHDVLDKKLPLNESHTKDILSSFQGNRLVSESQWMFFPYSFPEKMWERHWEVDRRVILPFTGRAPVGKGSFGIVEKMTISPSQHAFPESMEKKPVFVAQKQLSSEPGTTDFDREFGCLSLLGQLNHPNIISLWGSYTYDGKENFLFPYIEQDLHRFFEGTSRYREFQWDFTFYSALTGLASALSKTHRLDLNETEHEVNFTAIGYHHDLRPANVLVSEDTFILADYGLGRMKPADSVSHTRYKWGGRDYVAPECTDTDDSALTANRAVDVWAFGCIIAEVVTFMQKGSGGVADFRHKRQTTGRFLNSVDSCFYHPDGSLKTEVIEWMETLRSESLSSNSLSRLLDVSLEALRANPQSRPDMAEVHMRLAVINFEKHIQSVQERIRQASRSETSSASYSQHRVGSLSFAQRRFEEWRRMALNGSDTSYQDAKWLDSRVGGMKDMLRLLGGGSENSVSEVSSNRISDIGSLVQMVEDLWKSLPGQLQSHEDVPEEILADETTQCDEVSENIDAETILLQAELEEAANAFQRSLPALMSQDEVLQIASVDEIYDITDSIQAKQVRNLPKIVVYLNRLQGYEKLIESMGLGGTAITKGLWGPLGLILKCSSPLDGAFDSLMDAVVEAGQALPNFEELAPEFRRELNKRGALVPFFKEILMFYKEALGLFDRSNWMHAFHQLWPKHYSNMSEIIAYMSRLTELMRAGVLSSEQIRQESEFRRVTFEQSKAHEREACRQEFSRIETSFHPMMYDETLHQLRGTRSKNSGHWIFRNKSFVQWLEGSHDEAKVLWLQGIPGAGKTVLCSTIIDWLACKPHSETMFAFLTYQQSNATALSTIQSLTFQLARRNDDFKRIVNDSMNEKMRGGLSDIGNVLFSILRCVGSASLVLDGVDEMGPRERERLISEIFKLRDGCPRLRVIISSRAEADISGLMENRSIVIPINQHNQDGIKIYVHNRSRPKFDGGNIPLGSQPKIDGLLTALAVRAKGMFLYARLVMDMIEHIYDYHSLERELTVPPEDYKDAYHRIMERHRPEARRLLGWIAFASVTSVELTVEEAQQALAVIPDKKDQVYCPIGKIDVLAFLGPIVEVVGARIRLVHFTAREYISSRHLGDQRIDLEGANLDLAMQCMHYLCQDHHSPDLSREERSQKLVDGQYSLHALATRMWFDLVQQYLQSTLKKPRAPEIFNCIEKLWETRKSQGSQQSQELEKDEERDVTAHNYCDISYNSEANWGAIFESLKADHPLILEVLYKVLLFRQSSFIFTGSMSQDSDQDIRDPLSLTETSQKIHQAFDSALCSRPTTASQGEPGCHHETCARTLQLYGPRPFKCHFPQCDYFQWGFFQRSQKDKHVNSHNNPLKCPVYGCEFEQIGFLNEAMSRNHAKAAHQKTPLHQETNTSLSTREQVESVLCDLVRKDDVQLVEHLLTKYKKILKDNVHYFGSTTNYKFLRVAAFSASRSMLKLLLDRTPSARSKTKRYWDAQPWDALILEAIRNKNVDALSYLLSRSEPLGRATVDSSSPDTSASGQETPMEALVSNCWTEGIEIWSKAIRTELHVFPSLNVYCKMTERSRFSFSRLFKTAARSFDGEKALLLLWKITGFAQILGPVWASECLRRVAEHVPSVKLASYLLESGAEVNSRKGENDLTALHLASMRSTAENALLVEFLLHQGADPGLGKRERKSAGKYSTRVIKAREICDEPGAQNIHHWLTSGKTFDQLVEETKWARQSKDSPKRETDSKDINDEEGEEGEEEDVL